MKKKLTAMELKQISLDSLSESPLFSDFNAEMREAYVRHSSIKSYQKGQCLFLIGDPANYFYILINGLVKLFRETNEGHESILGVLKAGQFFGKASIIEEGIYAYNVEAVEDTVVLKTPGHFLINQSFEHESFAKLLLKLMQSRLQDINSLGLVTEHLTAMNTLQRIGCFLLGLCDDQIEGCKLTELPYEKGLIAAQLGMKQESFSRAINQLHGMGVHVRGSSVQIDDIYQLRSYVCNNCSAIKGECHYAEP